MFTPGVLKIEAVALHDYTARSDKELSFKRGDSLQVIEKTPDNNWWDGFVGEKRGFIPVAYIEILELKPTPTPSALPVPPRAPARKSSMPQELEEAAPSKPPTESTILEEHPLEAAILTPSPDEGEREANKTPEVKVESPGVPEPPVKRDETPPPVTSPKHQSTPEVKKPPPPQKSGAVKAITSRFQETQQQPRVLVEPRHRRQHSDHKVGMMTSQFETKAAAAAAPPPIKPKPLHIPPSPSETHPQGAFPIMAHPKPGSLPSASPLQQIALQSQVGQKPPPPQAGQKPAQLRKPAPSKPTKSSFRGKKDKGKGEEKAITKPPPPAKPVPPPGMGSLRDRTAELNAEFQAKALARRRQAEEGAK